MDPYWFFFISWRCPDRLLALANLDKKKVYQFGRAWSQLPFIPQNPEMSYVGI